MAMDPIPITTAPNLMVTVGVCHSLTNGARGPLLHHPQTQPILQAEAEFQVLEMETQGLGRDNIQPITSMR